MGVDEDLLRRAREAAIEWVRAQERAEGAKDAYHRAVRRLHLAGASYREIAAALEISHQRVHQIVDAAGGPAAWRPRKKAPSPACSFCGRPKAEAGRLVAGPGVFICDACVVLAEKLVRDPAARAWPLEVAPGGAGLPCSFCGAAAEQAGVLVAGPGVRICAGCVHLCAEVVGEQLG